ncbi:hypothetical protein TTRE_0000202301 [Trichuris trichiura]|uniref:Uncharacterized protein n=1 Tax=Trichuris trichiura TaxID=36087 RepID=A0A077Z121_TRITR|nr:hypothetical protein TTRE_0000202301 [Trichuris trichiura]
MRGDAPPPIGVSVSGGKYPSVEAKGVDLRAPPRARAPASPSWTPCLPLVHSYTEEDIGNTAPIVQPQSAVQQSLPGVHSGLNLSTPSPVASGLYSTPIMPSICRGHKATGASIPGNSSPHRMQSPLFPGSIVHNAPQTPTLLTTPMTLSHYGSGLRAMTAFGGISSAPPNLAANLRRHHCKLCPAPLAELLLLVVDPRVSLCRLGSPVGLNPQGPTRHFSL